MRHKALAIAASVCALILFAPHPSRAQQSRQETEAIVKDYLAMHPEEVGEIAKGYFIKHPEAVGAILAELLKLRSSHAGAVAAANARIGEDRSAAIASNSAALFTSGHQVTLGNPAGDVTLVEFFDYSCGFCKRALADTLALLAGDPKLKIVLKEFPVLGPGSVEAARVAVAVRMQDPAKYLAFHRQLLGSPGPASREKALETAKDLGLDMVRLERDMASEEVTQAITESATLARALGITGTPGYVIGNDVVLGAVGSTALKDKIAAARQHLN